jgi:hypothetical protein
MGTKITYATLAILAFFAGATVSFFTLPVWVSFAVNVAKEGSRTDWLGFFGSVAAGTMALIGAGVAWLAVHRQIKSQESVFEKTVAANDALARRRESAVFTVLKKDMEIQLAAIDLIWKSIDLALSDERSAFLNIRIGNAMMNIHLLPAKVAIDQLTRQSRGLDPIKEREFIPIASYLLNCDGLRPTIDSGPVGEETGQQFQLRVMKIIRIFFTRIAAGMKFFDPESAKMFDERHHEAETILPTIQQFQFMHEAYVARENAMRSTS